MLTQKRLSEILDYDLESGVFTWTKGSRKGKVAGIRHDTRGFMKVSIDGERHLLHRLAWLWMTGAMPRANLAHLNGQHGDNRWSNLREGDRSQKRQYQAPWREPTGILGVSKVGDRFEAMLEVQGKVFNLGSFAGADEAQAVLANALQRAREKLATGVPKAA